MLYYASCSVFVLTLMLWLAGGARSKSFSAQLVYLFWGVYYIFPPLSFFLLVPYPGYVNMSGESIFLPQHVYGKSYLVMGLLSLVFVSALNLFARVPVHSNQRLIMDVDEGKRWILFILAVLVISVFMMNAYLVAKAGGLYAFYFGSDWHARYENSGPIMVAIMNLKSILPCVGAGLSGALLRFKRHRLTSAFVLFLFILLLVFGGSNRKFALLAVFIYFIVCVDLLGMRRAKGVFYGMAGFMFLLFQALLFLRSSSFSLDALAGAFEVMGEVVLTSEPIGTYSVNLMLLDKMLYGGIAHGNFYDFFKIFLLPFRSILDFSQPNVAWVLGSYVNDVQGFTFFPTLLIEGMYNKGVLGVVVLVVVYLLLLRVVLKRVSSASTLFSALYWVSIYAMCMLQMIRGYTSVCIAYFLITTALFLAWVLLKSGGRYVFSRP